MHPTLLFKYLKSTAVWAWFFARALPTKMLPGGWIFVEAKSVMPLVLPPTCNSRKEFTLFVYTVVKVDGATPKRWFSKGPCQTNTWELRHYFRGGIHNWDLLPGLVQVDGSSKVMLAEGRQPLWVESQVRKLLRLQTWLRPLEASLDFSQKASRQNLDLSTFSVPYDLLKCLED